MRRTLSISAANPVPEIKLGVQSLLHVGTPFCAGGHRRGVAFAGGGVMSIEPTYLDHGSLHKACQQIAGVQHARFDSSTPNCCESVVNGERSIH